MRHPQAFVVLLIGVVASFAAFMWGGGLWGALGALITGLTLAFVMAMAWLWSPKSGIGRRRRPTPESMDSLR
jgi:hypothetical protein